MVKFVKGNEAVVIGALYAGCDVYFGYPITPASEIAHTASAHFPAVGKVFLQAECETASINMLFGAASAGKLAMTGTSGPGMSLMQEGLSYMAGAQLPGLVVNVQRAGPGLGNIYPEQADYNQAVKGGGHGNYRSIVMAPGSVQEMCDLTYKALELAFKYRNPAIVLTDAVIGQMMETLVLPERGPVPTEVKSWAVQGTAETSGNLISSIFLDAAAQEAHNIALRDKYASMAPDAMAEKFHCDDAEIILAAYGSSARVARSAVMALRSQGIKAGLFRPQTLFPFPVDSLRATTAGKRVLAVELSWGQFRDDLASHLGMASADLPLANRMGGMVISVEEVVSAAKKALSGPALGKGN